MKIIQNKFDKHLIPDLPRVLFEGRIVTIQGEEEANRAVDYLFSQEIIGLDTETRPSFRKGASMNKVALLQISTHDVCFLFRLNLIGMPPSLIRLLEDTTITKVGLSWHDDLRQLRRSKDFKPGTFVELQEFVRDFGIDDLSLQKLYANIFHQKISKNQRLTNWEADVLTDAQKQYAATDAWACIMLYEELCRMRETNDYELEIIPEPEPPQPIKKEEPKPVDESEKKRKKTKSKKYYRHKNRKRAEEKKTTTPVTQ